MQDLFISNRAWVQREQPSHGVSCILQEFREIFGLDAEFTQFDRMYFTFFLERDQCINEIGRTVALLLSHHFGHFHVTFCTVMTEGFEVCFRQGNESGSGFDVDIDDWGEFNDIDINL